MKSAFIFGLLFQILFSATVWAGKPDSGITVKCDKLTQPLAVSYCVHIPKVTGNKDVLYYLHGLNNSEETWQDEYFFTGQVRAFWAKHQIAPPTVVSVSFGPLWVLAEKNDSPNSGLFDAVTKGVIPLIEAGLGGVKGRRLLVGESMGGFNSIQLSLKTQLFVKAAILCAPIADITPFATEAEVTAFIERSGGWQYYKEEDPTVVKSAVAQMLQLSKAFFPTPEAYAKANPLELAKNVDSKTAPKLYVADGLYDKYLSYESTEKFIEQLKGRGLDVQWRPQWGGHCAIDIPTLAKFLTK